MMTRGNYTVQEMEAAKQASRDNSYRTCVLTMFIFLGICIILIIVAWPWRSPANQNGDRHLWDKQSGSLLTTEPTVKHQTEKTTEDYEAELVSARTGVSEDHLQIRQSTPSKPITYHVPTSSSQPGMKPTLAPAIQPKTSEASTPTPHPETSSISTHAPYTKTSQSSTHTSQPETKTISTTAPQLETKPVVVHPETNQSSTTTSEIETNKSSTTAPQPEITPVLVVAVHPETSQSSIITPEPETNQSSTTATQPETTPILVIAVHPETNQSSTTTSEIETNQSSSTTPQPETNQSSTPASQAETKPVLIVLVHPETNQSATTTSEIETNQSSTTAPQPETNQSSTTAPQPETTPILVIAVHPETNQSSTTTSEIETNKSSTTAPQPETTPVLVVAVHPETSQTSITTPEPETNQSSTTAPQPETNQSSTPASQSETKPVLVVLVHPETNQSATTTSEIETNQSSTTAPQPETNQSSTPASQSETKPVLIVLVHPETNQSATTTSEIETNQSSTTAPQPETNQSSTPAPQPETNQFSTSASETETNQSLTLSSETETNQSSTLSSETETNQSSTLSSETETNQFSTLSSETETNPSSTSASQPETKLKLVLTVQPETIQSSTTTPQLETNLSSISSSKSETTPIPLLAVHPETSQSPTTTPQPETKPILVLVTQPETNQSSTTTPQPETNQSSTTAPQPETKPVLGLVTQPETSQSSTTTPQPETNQSSTTAPLPETKPVLGLVTQLETSQSSTTTAHPEAKSTSAFQEYNSSTDATRTAGTDSDAGTGLSMDSSCAPYGQPCTSSACKVLSSRMLSLMNHSEDPCEDFYEFACGGLRENRNLLQHDPELDVWTRISDKMKKIKSSSPAVYQKFKMFYDQCVSYDSDVNETSRWELVREILSGVGNLYNRTGWESNGLKLNLTSLLVKLLQHNSAPLFDVRLDVDKHNTSRFLLKLTPPTHVSKFQPEPQSTRCRPRILSVDSKHIDAHNIYLMKYLSCKNDFSQYLDGLEATLRRLNLFPDMALYNVTQNIKSVRLFIDHSIRLHTETLPPAGEMRQTLLSKNYKQRSVSDLESFYPEVDWRTLFSALVGQPVGADAPVQLYFDDYFNSLFSQLRMELSTEDNKRVMHNALLAMFVHTLYVDLVQTQSPCARDDYCLRVASGLLEDVSSGLYLSTFTKWELSAMYLDGRVLFDQLKQSLIERLLEEKWLTDESRSDLVNKLQEMTVFVDGGKAVLNDPDWLNDQLSDQDIKSSKNYLQNAVSLTQRYRRNMYSLYNSEPNRTIWSQFLLPYDTQAISVYELNAVAIPYGLIGSPHNASLVPNYVFRARVGSEVARQIAHHFDSIGIEYGAAGYKKSSLSGPSKETYTRNEENYGMEYGFLKTWVNQNGQIFDYQLDSRTQNERFADKSALNFLYTLYKKSADSERVLPWIDRSSEQLYYMLVAQEFCTKDGMLDYIVPMYESEHLPPFLRVNKMLESSKHFAEVFKCAVGSKMNPEVKFMPFPEMEEEDDSGGEAFDPQ